MTAKDKEQYWSWRETSDKWEVNPRTRKMETHEEREHRLEMEHLNRIFSSYRYYETSCNVRLKRRVAHAKMLPPAMRELLPNLDQKFERMRSCFKWNQRFLDAIVKAPLYPNQFSYGGLSDTSVPTTHNLDKVRSTLKQCVRDWAEEGKRERDAAYGPIIEELKRLYPNEEERVTKLVVNPGCGLGRLTWEVARLGFKSEGNEFSYFMLLCSHMIINKLKQDAVTIYPYADQNTNQWSPAEQSRPIKIPHVDPYTDCETKFKKRLDYSIVAGDFTEVYKQKASFDVVVSCFFLDTAKNILQYLKVISHILRPGGYLVNLGPLLYHFADDDTKDPSIELTYEELKSVIPSFGLKMIREQLGVKCPYTSNIKSMLQMHYDCVCFTLQKVEEPKEAGLRFPEGYGETGAREPQELGGMGADQ